MAQTKGKQPSKVVGGVPGAELLPMSSLVELVLNPGALTVLGSRGGVAEVEHRPEARLEQGQVQRRG